MRASVFFLFVILVIGKCVEEVPRASPIRSSGSNEVRRAPVYKPQNTPPRAHGFKRTSTGVRRSPHVRVPPPKRNQRPMREPLSLQAIPLPSIAPMSFPVVTFPPLASFPSLPTLPTIAMPTLPGFTMPPSFQRLMGNTTPSPAKDNSEKIHRTEHKRPKRPKNGMEPRKESSIKRLSPISSRLPKYVNSQNVVVVKPEENADWIVPF